ncbi:MAG TPA: PEP-CTERM sorting domain-containing protein [Lacipirellulaceae bacterium]|jgi:hypothetical protein|nr:PEP-CTERM sorting domain-containing protein [Lacipirellulaceae bacterium]
MTLKLRKTLFGAALCALVFAANLSAQAATIIKLNLGGVGPDVGMGMPAGQPPGVFSTIDQTAGPSPTGDQLTDIEYTAFLNFIPDVNTNTASFSMNGLTAVGPANVFGSLVIQNFNGGVFSLYDPADNLLLQGPMGNSALTGVIGPPGTGALFTTTLGNVSGGSLAPLIAPGSVSLSMNLANVNGGNGFGVAGGGPQLNAFVADGSLSISADQAVPEPATLALLGIASLAAITIGGRRR